MTTLQTKFPVLPISREQVQAIASGSRDSVIKSIKDALRRRSGRPWSVTGGRGTAYGWITIDVPPAARTWSHEPKVAGDYRPGLENYDEIDTGKPFGHMGPEDRETLRELLGLERVHQQGVSISACGSDYRVHVARAHTGDAMGFASEQYWD